MISQKGTSNFSLQKISVEDTKNYLNDFLNYDHFPYKLNLNKISNKFRGGNLKNLKIKTKFSLLEDFLFEEIVGTSNFSNIRFDYNNKDFKQSISIRRYIILIYRFIKSIIKYFLKCLKII